MSIEVDLPEPDAYLWTFLVDDDAGRRLTMAVPSLHADQDDAEREIEGTCKVTVVKTKSKEALFRRSKL